MKQMTRTTAMKRNYKVAKIAKAIENEWFKRPLNHEEWQALINIIAGAL